MPTLYTGRIAFPPFGPARETRCVPTRSRVEVTDAGNIEIESPRK